LIEVQAIGQDHIHKGAPMLILAMSWESDVFAEGEG
jgi:hypothetical protein